MDTSSLLFLLISFVASSHAQACTGGFKANPTDCTSYFQCSGGNWVKMSCGTLYWNAGASVCDWPASSGCTPGSGPQPTQAPGPKPTQAPPTNAPVTKSPPVNGGKFFISEIMNFSI